MKYIITEEQFNKTKELIRAHKREQIILNFFDEHLSPYDGWDSHEEYARTIKLYAGELFIHFTKNHTGLHRTFLWYSICDNQNLEQPIPEGHCPLVEIPQHEYDAFDGYFGDTWKPVFKKWFLLHTGLEVVQVDSY
jgi:hypothetical protein